MFERIRRVKPLLALVAVGAIGLVVSGCALVKPGSLTVSQPQGIGSVRVHFNLCSIGGSSTVDCGPTASTERVQYLIGIAVPPGSAPPASFTAAPIGAGAPIVFTRSDEVAAELALGSGTLQKLIEALGEPEDEEAEETLSLLEALAGKPWPPSGLQGVGYLSAPVDEVEGATTEWSADADFGLPSAADGSPFPGPFTASIAYGARAVGEKFPASRPVKCAIFEEGVTPDESNAFCLGGSQQAQVGTADLKITAPAKPTPAFVGGSGQVAFKLNYAGTPPAVPTFAMSATTTAKGGKAKVASGSFTPTAASSPGKVTVSVPKKTKVGTYTVTLTATTPQGGTATQTAKLKVTKPKLKFGGVKLDPAKGTATLKVTVPSGGKLTISGKGVAKVKKKSKKKKTLKVAIAPTGSASSQLDNSGSLKLKVKAKFKPTSGISVSKTKTIVLKLG